MAEDDEVRAQIEDIIREIAVLRQRLDGMVLPLSEPKRDLAMHLAMAELAAVRFRIQDSAEDEIIVVDS
ncbi:MAG: hypothetical protein ABUS57_01525 [Pseudomonadota bacterium]